MLWSSLARRSTVRIIRNCKSKIYLQRCSSTVRTSSNPAMQFPCLDKLEQKSAELKKDEAHRFIPGKLANQLSPEDDPTSVSSIHDPVYGFIRSGYEVFRSEEPIFLDYGGVLPNFELAYETWGRLNEDKSNAILIHTGLSASSHARSLPSNTKPGWWENFIGPGNPVLDTDKWFIICTNVLGGCYGSTGPSSLDPGDNQPYATRFPMLSIQDMVRAQKRLVDSLGITHLEASVGSSMGGMQSLAYGQLFPDSVNKIVSVSACARSHPSSIAMRHAQRQVLMADPNWKRGFYYPTKTQPDRIPPHVGMKLAREIATVTYRSGPEWESRFSSERLDDEKTPVLCPDFLIETYLDHQGEKFSLEYDANSFLYISKTMDLFTLAQSHIEKSEKRRLECKRNLQNDIMPELRPPDEPYKRRKKRRTTTPEEAKRDLKDGMKPLRNKDVLVIGVKTDSLFPYWQQREIVELLDGPNDKIKHVELDENASLYGHDTFLLDLEVLGSSIGKFLRVEI